MKRDFTKRSRIAVFDRTAFREWGELGRSATQVPRRWMLRMMVECRTVGMNFDPLDLVSKSNATASRKRQVRQALNLCES